MEWEIQKAIYNLLVANSTLLGLVTGIYDEPPIDAVYPYIVIGGGSSTPHLKNGKDGINNLFLLTIFTKPVNLGFSQALKILHEVRKSVHLKNLTISGYVNQITKIDSTDRERDGDYRNIDVRLRTYLEEV